MNLSEQMNMVPSALDKTKDWASQAIGNLVSRAEGYRAKQIQIVFSGKYKLKNNNQIDGYSPNFGVKTEPEKILEEFMKELGSLNPVEANDEILSMNIEWTGFDEGGNEIEGCSGTLKQDTQFL